MANNIKNAAKIAIQSRFQNAGQYSDFDYSFNIPHFDVIPFYGDFINIIPKQKNNLLIYKKKI